MRSFAQYHPLNLAASSFTSIKNIALFQFVFIALAQSTCRPALLILSEVKTSRSSAYKTLEHFQQNQSLAVVYLLP